MKQILLLPIPDNRTMNQFGKCINQPDKYKNWLLADQVYASIINQKKVTK